jgi:hypothetical protein
MRRLEGLGRGLRGLGSSNGPTVSANPDFTDLAFTAGGSGVEDSLAATYTYAGNYPLVFRGVTSTVFTPPGADGAAIRANIIAGTGTGNLEDFAIDPFSGGTLNVTAGQLTSSSNSATYIHGFIEEKTNTGFSEVRTVAVSGLDFTAPTFSSAEATNANTVVITFSENVFGTVATSQFAFNINGSPATITNAVRSGATVTLTVSNTMAAGNTLNALSYTPGVLEDAKGSAVAAFSGQSITNSLVAPVSRLANTIVVNSTSSNITTATGSGITAQAGTNRCAILAVHTNSRGVTPTSMTATWGATSFDFIGWVGNSGTFRPIVALFKMDAADIPAGSNAITVTSGSSIAVDGFYARLIEYENVNQTTPVGTPATAFVGGGPTLVNVTVNITTATSAMLSAAGLRAGTTMLPASSNKGTLLYTNGTAPEALAHEELPGTTGNNTHAYTITSAASGVFTAVAVEIFKA